MARVSVDSDCPIGYYCQCDFKPDLCAGPCANQAGGELCDDVDVVVSGQPVGGVAELPHPDSQESAEQPSSGAVATWLLATLAGALGFAELGAIAYAWRRLN